MDHMVSNINKSILETELGSRIFMILLLHPNGLSGYEISKQLYPPKKRRSVSLSYQGKVAGILQKMKREQLIKRKVVKSEGNRIKIINIVDFNGLAHTILKGHPKENEFVKEEIREIAHFLRSLEYKKFLIPSEKEKSKRVYEKVESLFLNLPPPLQRMMRINILDLFKIILGFGSWSLEFIPNFRESLKKADPTPFIEVYRKLAKLPKSIIVKLACG